MDFLITLRTCQITYMKRVGNRSTAGPGTNEAHVESDVIDLDNDGRNPRIFHNLYGRSSGLATVKSKAAMNAVDGSDHYSTTSNGVDNMRKTSLRGSTIMLTRI